MQSLLVEVDYGDQALSQLCFLYPEPKLAPGFPFPGLKWAQSRCRPPSAIWQIFDDLI